jgi:hypothetical protein
MDLHPTACPGKASPASREPSTRTRPLPLQRRPDRNGANASKQSRNVVGMQGVDPTWQADELALQNQVRRFKDLIDLLLKSQG